MEHKGGDQLPYCFGGSTKFELGRKGLRGNGEVPKSSAKRVNGGKSVLPILCTAGGDIGARARGGNENHLIDWFTCLPAWGGKRDEWAE